MAGHLAAARILASLFDPPRDPTQLQRIDRARVTSNIQGTQARGLLALGWLMSRLGWHNARRLPDGKSLRSWQLERGDGKAVRLELATATGSGTHGVAGLELFAGPGNDERWAFDPRRLHPHPLPRPAAAHAAGAQPRRRRALASALGARGRDPMYKQALASAAALVEATA